MKYENERKRWQDDIEDQKQLYEKELDELRVQLRKKRTTDNLTNNQEVCFIFIIKKTKTNFFFIDKSN
jgi:hypothetical protein